VATPDVPGSALRRPLFFTFLAVICLGAVVYASAHPSQWVWNVPDWYFTPGAMPSIDMGDVAAMPGLPDEPKPSSPIWAIIALVLGIAVAAVILFFIIRYLIRLFKGVFATRIEKVPARDMIGTGAAMAGAPLTPEQVRDAVAEALQQLDSAATPTDAIILAWLALEDAAHRFGVTRDPSQTPTEFTSNLLAKSAVPTDDLVGLRTVYLRARFSKWTATGQDVQDSRLWLEHIARTLEGVRA